MACATPKHRVHPIKVYRHLPRLNSVFNSLIFLFSVGSRFDMSTPTHIMIRNPFRSRMFLLSKGTISGIIYLVFESVCSFIVGQHILDFSKGILDSGYLLVPSVEFHLHLFLIWWEAETLILVTIVSGGRSCFIIDKGLVRFTFQDCLKSLVC